MVEVGGTVSETEEWTGTRTRVDMEQGLLAGWLVDCTSNACVLFQLTLNPPAPTHPPHSTQHTIRHLLTSAALRTVSVLSPILRPLSPAHAMSTTPGSLYTTNPYLRRHIDTSRQGRRTRWRGTVHDVTIASQ